MKSTYLKYYTGALLALLAFSSCKKVINLNLGNVSNQLVIEANIDNENGTQYVTLSRNVPFTSANNYPAVTGALVSMEDDHGHQYHFTEGPSGTYSIKNVSGTAGTTYFLTVTTDEGTYAAQSTMPAPVKLDSLTEKADIFGASKGKRLITVNFQDPPKVTNQYRFIMYVNRVQVKTVFAFDDEFIDGKYVKLDLEQNDIDIYPNDTVKVEMQCIDKPVYTYWYTLSQQQANNPGGQVAPANPPTNITPATLGYFSAHTTQSITFVVK